ncbi:unnamed protein product [Vicia faba]|uniref:Uncharacterized protein n=1 Tax=Vicia faba TaxID=3906 RepID=A0AAV1B5Z6_VICFA|nr:unnamed protein product [Vicia faba]
MIRSENISLQSKNNYWEVRAKYSADRLYRFKKENEHQLFILKHENELISNAEKQARQLVTNLFQRIHCLQNEVLMETYRSMLHELQKLQVEEEMIMRKLYEVMSVHGLTKQNEDNSNASNNSAGAEQINNEVNTTHEDQ